MKISEKLVSIIDSFTVTIVDNGYIFEVSGRNTEGDYKTVKLVVLQMEELFDLIAEVSKMDRD